MFPKLLKQSHKSLKTLPTFSKLRVLSHCKFSSRFQESNFFENYKSPFAVSPEDMDELVKSAVGYIKSDLYEKKSDQCPTGSRWLHSEDINEMVAMHEIYKEYEEPMPEKGGDLDDILHQYFKNIDYSTNDNQGGYMCWTPSGGIFSGALADFIASATNRCPTMWMIAVGAAAIEDTVVSWFLNIMGMDRNPNPGGLLTSGGSMANFQAIHVARKKYLENPEDILKFTIYGSDYVHYCIDQGVSMCGIPQENLRKIKSNPDGTINLELLQKRIELDISRGYKPIMIIGIGGASNSGAIDDLETLSNLSKKYNCWFHVDGAYGAFFNLTDAGKKLLKGIETCDSLVLDPHKTLFLPYGCGALLVKNKEDLLNANSHTCGCMHNPITNTDFPHDIMDLGFELSRPFRGFAAWLSIKLYGIDAFRKELEYKLQLTQYMYNNVKNLKYIKIIEKPLVTIFTFQLDLQQLGIENKLSLQQQDELNMNLMDAINNRGNILLSAAKTNSGLDGEFQLRIAISSYRTTKYHCDIGLKDIQDSINQIIEENVSKYKS